MNTHGGMYLLVVLVWMIIEKDCTTPIYQPINKSYVEVDNDIWATLVSY